MITATAAQYLAAAGVMGATLIPLAIFVTWLHRAMNRLEREREESVRERQVSAQLAWLVTRESNRLAAQHVLEGLIVRKEVKAP
jgi:hypothetical protein